MATKDSIDKALLIRYGLGDLIGLPYFEEPVKVQLGIVTVAKNVKALIDGYKAPSNESKVDDPYTAGAKEDAGAKMKAAQILGKLFDIVGTVEHDVNVMFWLGEDIGRVAKFVGNEVAWHAEQSAKAWDLPTTVDPRPELADDYRALRVQAKLALSMVNPDDVSDWKGTVILDKGKLDTTLPTLPGNFGPADHAVGKYAPSARFTITVGEGKAAETFSDPKLAMRAIWLGADRVGVKQADLFAAIDQGLPEGETWSTLPGDRTLSINGRPVTLRLKKNESK